MTRAYMMEILVMLRAGAYGIFPELEFLCWLRSVDVGTHQAKVLLVAPEETLWEGLAVWIGALPYYYLLAKLGETFEIPTAWIVAGAAVMLLVGLIERWRRSRRGEAG